MAGHPAVERSSPDLYAPGQVDSAYLASGHSAVAHPSGWPSAEASSTYPSSVDGSAHGSAYGHPVADSSSGHSSDRGSVVDAVGGDSDDGADDVEVVGRTGARFGPYSVRKSRRAKEFDTGSTPVVEEPAAGTPPGEPTPEQSAERTMPLIKPWAGALVRPYAHTGGRTRSSHTLELEALVSSSWHPGIGDAVLTTHHRRMIVDLCVQPRSVAEVAALLSVPLGVVRVLLGDLASAGVVIVHATAGTNGDGAPDLAFMQRVLVGLRRL